MIDINKLEFKKFPGGELHLTSSWVGSGCHILSDHENEQRVYCRINSSDDFMKLALFTNAYKSLGYKLPPLVLPYIPYARQDRIPTPGEALSIKVFAQLLNTLGYPKVYVLDPHSDVSTALIDNVCVIPQWNIWGVELIRLNAENELDKFDLISPDAGALKKIYKLQEFVMESRCNNIRVGMKHRDTETGQITGTSVDGEPKNKVGVVVDDICDGGRTFVELAKVIRKDYDKLILCITHGIFSKGFDELYELYDEIHTTNSWNPLLEGDKNLHVIQIEKL